MKILLHMCCGPCASAIVESLQADGHDVYGYFFNPNIHPLVEFRKRMDSAYKLANIKEMKMIGSPTYGLDDYLRNVVYREENKCLICYSMRLNEAARMARVGNFDAFTSTLFISPHQNHEQMIEIAKNSAKKESTKLYYQDFRKLFKRSIELSKEYELYRQQYCGCIYSEEERYRHQKKI
jgi:hypothetical protein